MPVAYFVRGLSYRELGDRAHALVEAQKAIERAHLWLEAAYAQVGRGDDAEWEMEQVLSADPDVSEERIRDSVPAPRCRPNRRIAA